MNALAKEFDVTEAKRDRIEHHLQSIVTKDLMSGPAAHDIRSCWHDANEKR